jgi:hypothetical protein
VSFVEEIVKDPRVAAQYIKHRRAIERLSHE